MLASLNAQDFLEYEHIVADGGSTDGTLDILARWRERIAQILTGPDDGTSQAVNRAVTASRGKYLTILNADDELATPNALGALAGYLEAHPHCPAVFGDMLMVDRTGRSLGRRTFGPDYDVTSMLVDRRHLPFAGTMIRKSAWEQVGGLDENLKFANDLDLYLRLACVGSFGHLGRVTGVFRLHPGSSTSMNIARTGKETLEVCLRHLENQYLRSILRLGESEVRAAIYVNAAAYAFHAGSPQEVRGHLFKAARLAPGLLLRPKSLVYFFASLGGARSMSLAASLTRKLIHLPGFYQLNNADGMTLRMR
jgi:GT2 family glycosyltransferase